MKCYCFNDGTQASFVCENCKEKEFAKVTDQMGYTGLKEENDCERFARNFDNAKPGDIVEPCKTHVLDTCTKTKKEDKTQRPQISRLPIDSLYKICLAFQWVSNNGKYKEDDWRKGVSWKDNYNSMQRHLMDYYKGIDTDPETGLPTLAHLGCRLLMALEMQIKGTGNDDRFKD